MEKLCCILDSEENYAVRMATCFNNKKVFPHVMRAFSETESYIECSKENEIVLLLVADNLYKESLVSTAGLIIKLSDQSLVMESADGLPQVGKYQAIDSIIRDVISLYESAGHTADNIRSAKKAKLVSVYSPNGYCGKTTLALALAHERGKKEHVIYINLEEFSGLGQLLPERKGNLSDALYYFQTGIGNGMGKYLSIISPGDGFDYYPPAACATDIPYMSTGVITDFVEQLAVIGSYSMVILDIGSLIKEPWKLLAKSDAVLMPKPDSLHREQRQMEFEKFLLASGYEDVLKKVVMVPLVRDEQICKQNKLDFCRLSSCEFGRMVSQIEF